MLVTILNITLLLLIIVLYQKSKTEEYAWSCTYKPNVDYYKQDWLLPQGAEDIVRGSIKDGITPF
jgi:hypothetical protein